MITAIIIILAVYSGIATAVYVLTVRNAKVQRDSLAREVDTLLARVIESQNAAMGLRSKVEELEHDRKTLLENPPKTVDEIARDLDRLNDAMGGRR